MACGGFNIGLPSQQPRIAISLVRPLLVRPGTPNQITNVEKRPNTGYERNTRKLKGLKSAQTYRTGELFVLGSPRSRSRGGVPRIHVTASLMTTFNLISVDVTVLGVGFPIQVTDRSLIADSLGGKRSRGGGFCDAQIRTDTPFRPDSAQIWSALHTFFFAS